MKRTIAAAVAVLALAPAGRALAGRTCGGSSGGSSGGGSFGGGSSGGSSDSGSSEPACTDATDIVGYRTCTKFAQWAAPRYMPTIILELGTAVRSFASPLDSATGSISHEDETFAYRVVGTPRDTPAAPESAMVMTARVGFGMRRGSYLVVEGEAGGLLRSSTRAEMLESGARGTPTLTPGGGIVLGALGVLGIRGGVGRVALGAEAAGGVRSISYHYESRYLACEGSTTQSVQSPILEARARADLWLSPFVSLGVTAGASVIDRGAWMAGVHIGLIGQAFGGLRD